MDVEITLDQLPKLFGVHDDRLWHYRAYVIRVIDGDTILCFVDRGFHDFHLEKVRLAGIDAPEVRPRVGTPKQRAHEKELAAKATNRLRALVERREVVLQTEKTGKFGRWLARIFQGGSMASINQVLLDEGLAVVYGSPRPWRDE